MRNANARCLNTRFLYYFENIIEELQEEIRELTMEIDDKIKLSEQAIKISWEKLRLVKDYVGGHPFQNADEEIWFFKNIKPRILSHLIYHNKILKIETKKPTGSEKKIKEYFESQLEKLNSYFQNNLDFYTYYRTDNNYLDHHYFLRNKIDIKSCLDTGFFESDHTFSTSYDYKVAKIIANDRLQIYLQYELSNVSKSSGDSGEKNSAVRSGITWTASKVALIELLYALHAGGVFNNGAADLKTIAGNLERLFNIDLGQFHRTFLEIRIRKYSKTKFLDILKEALEKRMDDADEN